MTYTEYDPQPVIITERELHVPLYAVYSPFTRALVAAFPDAEDAATYAAAKFPNSPVVRA